VRALIAGFDLTDYTRQETLKVQHDLGDPIPIIDIVLEDPYASTITPALDCLQEVCVLNEPFAYNQARNYVVDPTLASGSTDYTVSNPISATMTYTSNQISAKLNNTSVGTVSVAQTTQALLIQPGQDYMFSAYLTLSTDAFYVPRFGGGTLIFQSVAPLVNAHAFIQMDFLDAGTNLITSVVSANYTSGTRQQVSISGTAPDGCSYIKVYCAVTTTNTTNSGTAVFDTLQLEPMFFQNAGAYSTQSYPSPDCVVGQDNCRVLANGVTVREDRLFGGYITNLDADYEGPNRIWTLEVSGPAFVTAATSITTTYSSATDAGIFADIVSTNFPKLFTTHNIFGTGYTFDQVEWEDVFVRDVFNSVSQAAGDTWFIDQYFDVHCYPPGTNQSSFELSDSPDDVTSFEYYAYTYSRTVANMANRLKVFGAGANNTNPVTTDTFSGDGSTKTFTLTMRPETVTSVTVNGTTQVVGQFGIDKNGVSGIQCLVNKGLKEIIFNSAPSNSASNVVASYNYISPAIMRLWDMGSISKYGLVLDSRIDDASLVTNADVLQRGLQDLQTDSTPQTSITLSTQKSGLQVGDTIPITHVSDSLLSQPFLIQKIRAVLLGTDETNETVTEFQATLGPYLPTFLHHMKFVHKSVKHARTKTSVVAQEHLVTFDTIDYLENPTISVDTSVGSTTGGASEAMGVTIGINPGTGNPGSAYSNWTSLFADMATVGLSWVRFQLSWDSIELTQGNYSWTVLDDAVLHVNASGFKIMFTLRGAPSWALALAGQNSTTEPWYLPNSNDTSDTTSMAYFALQVATRYDGTHGHGQLDAIGFNEDFNIHSTSNSDTLTLNQTLTGGMAYTSFTINSSGYTPQAGTQLYFKGYNSADVASVSTDVSNGDTTVHVSSFTPATTYHAGDTINIAYVATNSSISLYDPGSAGRTTSNSHKGQPARNPIYASTVFNHVATAIRSVNSSIIIGMPCVWWMQPVNATLYPGSPSNNTAFYQQLFTDCAANIDALTVMDGHYYSNAVDPTAGNTTTATIAQWMADLQAVAALNGFANMPVWVTEFGWQADTVTTSSTHVSSTGSHTITVADATGASVGGTAIIDSSTHQETVTITGKSSTSITAVFAKTHSGTYAVTISLDCSATQQASNYSNVLTAIDPGGTVDHHAFLFTLLYGTGGTGSSLVKPDGTHQPAYTTVQSYIAAHPGTTSGGGGITNYAIDTFSGRTVSGGWGTASDGINTWSQPDGNATPSVGSGEGQLTGKVDTNEMICGLATVKDLEIVVRLTGTVASFKAGAISRYTNLNNYYFARINDSNSKLEICKYVGGTLTVITSTTFNPTPGTFYWLRFRTQGSSLKANAWQDGTTEPAGFMLTKTDTSLTGAKRFGLYSIANTTATVMKFDTFSAVSV
jgi:hypothetical protein